MKILRVSANDWILYWKSVNPIIILNILWKKAAKSLSGKHHPNAIPSMRCYRKCSLNFPILPARRSKITMWFWNTIRILIEIAIKLLNKDRRRHLNLDPELRKIKIILLCFMCLKKLKILVMPSRGSTKVGMSWLRSGRYSIWQKRVF